MNKLAQACVFGVILALLAGAGWFVWWKHNAPRRDSLAELTHLQRALAGNQARAVVDAVILPHSLAARTHHEQFEFLHKALRDEISPEGIKALRRHGTFGPLTNIFPQQAQQWAAQAGVSADQCVAFRATRKGVTAEAVLVKTDASTGERPYRIVRCNNIKQLAEEVLSAKIAR